MSHPDQYRLLPRGPREGPFGLPRDDGDADAGFPLGRRVLITEDNWLVAGEWQAALEDAGYEVVGLASSAQEALEICSRETPDLILMDIRLLGDRDGVEAAKDARLLTISLRCSSARTTTPRSVSGPLMRAPWAGSPSPS